MPTIRIRRNGTIADSHPHTKNQQTHAPIDEAVRWHNLGDKNVVVTFETNTPLEEGRHIDVPAGKKSRWCTIQEDVDTGKPFPYSPKVERLEEQSVSDSATSREESGEFPLAGPVIIVDGGGRDFPPPPTAQGGRSGRSRSTSPARKGGAARKGGKGKSVSKRKK